MRTDMDSVCGLIPIVSCSRYSFKIVIWLPGFLATNKVGHRRSTRNAEMLRKSYHICYAPYVRHAWLSITGETVHDRQFVRKTS